MTDINNTDSQNVDVTSDVETLADNRAATENLNQVRANDDRDNIQRPDTLRPTRAFGWVNPFEAPTPRDGFVQRWFRVEINNNLDDTLEARMEAGSWDYRKYDTLNDSDKRRYRSKNTHGFKGSIQKQRMILCERPIEIAHEEARYWEQKDLDKVEALGGGLPNMTQFGQATTTVKNNTEYYE